MQPATSLYTRRLHLRQINDDDVQAVYEYASDEENTLYMAFKCHASIADSKWFIDYAQKAWQEGSEYCYGIEFDGRLIGTTGFKPKGNEAFIGYIIHRDFWGQGLTTEAVSAMVKEIINMGMFQAITSCAHEKNRASIKILEKLGLRQVDSCAKEQFFNLPATDQVALHYKRKLC